MELKIRKLTESDWDLLVSWWEMYPEWKQGPSKKCYQKMAQEVIL